MNDVTIEKAYATALAAYAMAGALQDTLLTTDELNRAYLQNLRKQVEDLGLPSAEVKTEIERILSRQTV